MTILFLSIAGVIIGTLIGTFWYSPNTPMGRLHMQYLGFDKMTKAEQQKCMDDAKPHMPKMYASQMALSLLTSLATVFILTMSVQNGVPFSMALGFVFMNWLCFMVPVNGSNIIWGTCDPKIAFKKFLADIFSNLTILAAISLLTYFFV